MISTSFIHACDDACMMESAYIENQKYISNCIGTLAILDSQKQDLKAFDLFTESKEEYYTESVGNVIESLGKKILDIIQHFKDTINDIFRKWKERSWAKKDDVQKMREVQKRDPKAVARIQIALDNGDLDMAKFKDIDEFLDKCDKVLDEIDKKNVNPKSLQGRLNAAKSCLERNSKAIATVATTLGLVATAGTIILNYQNFKNNTEKTLTNETENIRKKADAKMAKIEVTLKKLDEMEKNGEINTANRRAILAQLANEVENVTAPNINKRVQFLRKAEAKFCAEGSRLHAKMFKKSANDISAATTSTIDNIRQSLKKEQDRQREVIKNAPTGSHIPGNTNTPPTKPGGKK